jgi:hypothetical protein
MKESIALCTAAGIDIRSLGPAEVVMLAGEIVSDRILQKLAYDCRVPASKGARERVAAAKEYRFATDAESDQFLKDLIELMEPADYKKALVSMSKGELVALRARIAAR